MTKNLEVHLSDLLNILEVNDSKQLVDIKLMLQLMFPRLPESELEARIHKLSKLVDDLYKSDPNLVLRYPNENLIDDIFNMLIGMTNKNRDLIRQLRTSDGYYIETKKTDFRSLLIFKLIHQTEEEVFDKNIRLMKRVDAFQFISDLIEIISGRKLKEPQSSLEKTYVPYYKQVFLDQFGSILSPYDTILVRGKNGKSIKKLTNSELQSN